ncbi:MAG: extracellular solute-binding protein [Bosea sp. (in: a-proteobacteria)]|jgi:putative spermidine/putrescine transport system substrate-binding protein
MKTTSFSKRQIIKGGAAAAGTALFTGFPNIVRAQSREIFIGGPGIPGLTNGLFPLIERKLNVKVLFEGTNSLVNFEKMQANKSRPNMTLVMMDDPVLVMSERENLIQRLPSDLPHLADVIDSAKPRGGMWVNWCQPMASFAYNTRAVKEAPTSYADAWDPRYRDRVVLVSMRITQAIVPLLAATHHATKAPLAQCLPLWREGIARMKELRPNILQVSSNYAQAQQLNETGECDILLSPDSRSTLLRKTQGAPVDQAFPREGLFAMPAGVALVRGGPNEELGRMFINEMMSPETQAYIAQSFFSRPTNRKTVLPAGLSFPELITLDWGFFTENRNQMIEIFEREISAR